MVRTIRRVVLLFLLASVPAGCQKSGPAVREFQVQASDVSLHVRIVGDPDSGCVLLAINGGPGLTSSYMLDMEGLAGPDCAVLTYDQRGLGESTQPSDPDSTASYTPLKYAEDVEAIRQAVGAERLHVMGHSWGGIVAMQYAILYPERVASLIFFGGGPPTWNDIKISQQRFGERVDVLMQAGVIPPPSEWGDNGIDPLLPAYFSDPTFTFPEDARGGPPEFSQTVSDLTSPNLVGMDMRGELALLQKPVLLMFGRDDPFGLPMAEASRDALVNAQVEFVVIDRCGHFWHECPNEFYPRVEEFLGNLSGSVEPWPQDPTPMAANQAYLDVFETVWQTVNDTFPDPTFGGADWKALRDQYEPLILAAEGDEEFFLTLNHMLWELNASHLMVIPSRPMSYLDLAGAEGGVGIDVRMIDGEAVIAKVAESSPADGAGLRPGYILRSVGGATIQEIQEADGGFWMPPYSERARLGSLASGVLLRTYGPPGTVLTVVYEDDQGELKVDLVRTQREGKSVLVDGVPPSFLEVESRRMSENIAYVRFNAFDPALLDQLLAAVDEQSDASGLILDLRGNGGGFFEVRKALLERLVREGTLFCRQEGRRGIDEIYLDPAPQGYEGPIVVLVDELSGSSSEEMAGGLQAIGRATIVGNRTPGKVMIAEFAQLPNGTFVYPVAITRLADGTILEGRGVIPDIEAELDRELLLQGIDSQLEAAIETIEGVMDGD
jgi:carboxyl-terminal processing protease